jgi:carbon monoxide dehydrogenase subunit G
MEVQESILIHAAPEKIWPYLVEPEKVLQWSSTFQKYEAVGEQHGGVGSRFYVEEKSAGILMKYTFEAVEWRENEQLCLRMISGTGIKAYQQTLRLESLPEGTRFTFLEDVELPMGFFGKIIGFLMQGMSRAVLKKILVKLKSLVEA